MPPLPVFDDPSLELGRQGGGLGGGTPAKSPTLACTHHHHQVMGFFYSFFKVLHYYEYTRA